MCRGIPWWNSGITPAPIVYFMEFGASSLDFELRCYLADVGNGMSVKSDLRYAIFAALNKEGISIPFPQQDVHIKGYETIADSQASKPKGIYQINSSQIQGKEQEDNTGRGIAGANWRSENMCLMRVITDFARFRVFSYLSSASLVFVNRPAFGFPVSISNVPRSSLSRQRWLIIE